MRARNLAARSGTLLSDDTVWGFPSLFALQNRCPLAQRLKRLTSIKQKDRSCSFEALALVFSKEFPAALNN